MKTKNKNYKYKMQILNKLFQLFEHYFMKNIKVRFTIIYQVGKDFQETRRKKQVMARNKNNIKIKINK